MSALVWTKDRERAYHAISENVPSQISSVLPQMSLSVVKNCGKPRQDDSESTGDPARVLTTAMKLRKSRMRARCQSTRYKCDSDQVDVRRADAQSDEQACVVRCMVSVAVRRR